MSLLNRLHAGRASSHDAVRPLLASHCAALKQELLELQATINDARLPPEVAYWLEGYRTVLSDECRGYLAKVQRAENLLAKDREDLIEEVFSLLGLVALDARCLGERLLSPLVRSRAEDRLVLKILNWLHGEHQSTRILPLAVSDGPPAIMPFLQVAPLYYFPYQSQRGLLMLPLLFHEFGHLLALDAKHEMREHIGELQQQIAAHLVPASRRNDRHDAQQIEVRRSIENAYYSWSIEFFCDAVGLVIAGPAFIFAFSQYLDSWNKTSFNLPAEKMAPSNHPVTWMRVRQLVLRSRSLGWHEAANSIETSWRTFADALGVKEDHRGFYDAQIEQLIAAKISDMLEVAGPREVDAKEVNAGDWQSSMSPVALLNAAWHFYHNSDAPEFFSWEQKSIEGYCLQPT